MGVKGEGSGGKGGGKWGMPTPCPPPQRGLESIYFAFKLIQKNFKVQIPKSDVKRNES